MRPIAVVGISTEVGKTVVSAIITEALGGYYWKAVQCGPRRDLVWVDKMLSQKGSCLKEAFCLKTPCSPHLAAKKEGVRIAAQDLTLPKSAKPLVIEGTGGILAPLNEKEVWLDAALLWNARFILVHHSYLGSLNHFFLTVEAMQTRKIPLLGVIFNGKCEPSTETMLLQKTSTSLLGRLPWHKELTSEKIQNAARKWQPRLYQALGL